MVRYRAARVFTGHETFAPGVLAVADGRVVAVAPAAPDAPADVDLGDVTLTPGFVDVHSHGGGGAAVSDDPRGVAAFHARHGTTTYIGSLVTGTLASLEAQVRELAAYVADGTLAGIHLEGPWLAERYHGAHPTALLRDPLPEEVRRLVGAGGDSVRMVTLAVERAGAVDSIRWLVGRGVVAALGHSDCTYDAARAALDAGVTGVTHLFNAMPPLRHRAPGPVLAVLRDDRAWLELIADGVHLHPEVVAWVLAEHPDRAVLVTDAMAAAGCADGEYMLGGLGVEVRDGIAHVAGTDTIAGSTLVLADAVRNVVGWGVNWTDAVRAATLNPARYLGLAGVGELVPGARADAVALTPDFRVARVLRRGVVLT